MASDLRIQAEVVVNSEQAESAFNRVGDKAQQMATEVATSAGKAGQSVDKIGDGAGASAEKFTRAESRISASIKRATNELELLGKTASQRLEFNIADKGLDASKFEPALKKLREVEAQAQAAQRAATGSLDKMGISAAQTAAALRGVPAQFTDIVTSLQGGQQPLTVLLQQGGQLKDVFGGVGAAARALGGYVLGLVNPFTVAAAAGVALALAYKQGSAEADAYNKALITTGNAAGTNASQLKAYAQEISAVVGTQGKAAESLAALASTGKIGAESLKEAAQAAVQYERATGQAVSKTAEQFASLRNEPLAAVLKLNDGMNFLTDSTYKQIKSLEEQGRTAEAANVAQRAFADTLAGRAGEMERNLGSVERGWIKVKDAAKGAWDAMLNIGRGQTNNDRLQDINKQLEDLQRRAAPGFGETEGGAATGRAGASASVQAKIAALQAQKAAIEGVIWAEKENGRVQAETAKNNTLLFDWDKQGESFTSKAQKRDAEILKARTEGQQLINAGLISEAGLRERIRSIEDKYKETGGGGNAGVGENEVAGIRAKTLEQERYLKLLQEQGGEALKLTEGEKLVIKIQEELKTSISGAARAQKEKALAAAEALAAADKQVIAEQAHIKALAHSEEGYRKDLAAMAQRTDAINQQAADMEAANAVYGKGKIAIEQYNLQLDQERLKRMNNLGLQGATTEELAREIDARKRLVEAMTQAEIKQTNQRLDEWKRSATEQAKLYEEEANLAGLTVLERDKIVAARQVELKLAKEIADINLKDWKDSLGNEDRAAKDAAIAKATAAAQIESSAAVAKVVRDDWAKTSDEINRSLTDALLRGFESGKDFAKNLRDTLVNMFKTLVLRPIIQFVVQPLAGGVLGLLGMPGAANAATGGGLMGMAGNASSLYGAATGIGSFTTAGMLPGFLSTALAGSTNALAMGLSGAWGAGGGMLSTLNAGASMLGSGSIMSGLGTIAGALGPIALGLGAIAALSGAFKGRGANHSGGVYSTATTDRNAAAASLGLSRGALGDFTDRANADIDKQLGQTVGQLSAVYQSLTKYAGDSAKQIDIAAGFAVNGKYKDEDAYAYFKLFDKATGGTLASYTRRDGGLGNDPTKAYAQFTADMGGALIEELKKADIPSWMKTVFDGLDKDITLDKLNSAVSLVQQLGGLFENMSRNLVGFAGMADTTFQKLVENMGGVEAASKGVAAYYQGFYSESERAANVRRDITAELTKVGLTLPATRAEFRALVEANIALGAAGAKTVATLLGVADAFAGVTQEVQDTAALLEAQAAALKKQRDDAYSALDRAVSAEKKLLQDQLSAARDVEKSIGSIFTLLHDNVLSLYGTVDGTRAMQAQQGQTFIADALATAKASGYLPDADQLKEAISAVRGELDNSTDNRAERDYAALVLAGQLSGMEDIAGKQLTDAKRTIQVLEGQSKQLDKTLDYWRQQIDIASGTYDATLSVSDAVNRLSALLSGGGKPGSSTPGGGGSSGYTAGGGVSQRVGYGADEALTSFDKFKAWYDGLRHNVDPKMLMGSGYQVPDWMRVMHMAGDSTDKELFGAYLNMKNNPETAKDYERIMTTGRSGMVADGSTLVRSDLSSMPKEIREYFEKDRNSLLSYEAMGIDPVLGYKLYKDGAGQFGIDKNTNLTSWLQQHKWTEGGVVSNNNAMDTLNNWKGYNLARWDLATGTVVDLDGKIYTADGQLIGSAGNGLMQQVYGSAFVGASGKDYGDATRSALYASQVTGGATQADYYANIKTGLDQAIASGKSAQDIADAIRSTGASMSDVAGAYGITVQQLEDNLRAGGATNIPKFAVGTNYVPRDMLAQIHEGEAIVPKAYNPWAGGGTSSNERLEALIERLTAEVAELRAAADATAANTGKSAAVLVSVQSGNSLTTAPVPVF